MRADLFCEIGRITFHEEARDEGNIKFFDTISEAREAFLIFISHQWLAWGDPDPENKQYEQMVFGVKRLAEMSRKSLKATYVWLDAFSIPQQNVFSQRTCIQSLPVYASLAKRFLIVAVQSVHMHTHEK